MGCAGHKSQQGGREELKSSVQLEDKEAEQIGGWGRQGEAQRQPETALIIG